MIPIQRRPSAHSYKIVITTMANVPAAITVVGRVFGSAAPCPDVCSAPPGEVTPPLSLGTCSSLQQTVPPLGSPPGRWRNRNNAGGLRRMCSNAPQPGPPSPTASPDRTLDETAAAIVSSGVTERLCRVAAQCASRSALCMDAAGGGCVRCSGSKAALLTVRTRRSRLT